MRAEARVAEERIKVRGRKLIYLYLYFYFLVLRVHL